MGEFATRVAQWGADQELEACCEWADETGWEGAGDSLRTIRRPMPVALVKRVLTAINESNQYWGVDARAAIREVAAWLHENNGGTAAASMLEKEVDQWVSQKSQKQ